MEAVPQRLKRNGWYVSPKSFSCFPEDLIRLGFLAGKNGVRADSAEIKVVEKLA